MIQSMELPKSYLDLCEHSEIQAHSKELESQSGYQKLRKKRASWM